jgi:subtilisin-like proprotein convertase family protein
VGLATARTQLRPGRTLAVGGALAALAAGALTMTDRAMALAPSPPPVCVAPNPVSTPSTGPAQAISDVGTPTVTSTITVAGAPAVLRDVDVLTNITHAHTADLRITLSHDGKTVVLKNPTLLGGDAPGATPWADTFAGTVWDDSADDPASDHRFTAPGAVTPLNPVQPLGAFIGTNPNGAWTLTVEDTDTGAGGALNNWALTIAGLNEAPPLTTTVATQPTPVTISDNATANSQLTVTGAASLWDVNLATNIDHTAPGDLVVTLAHLGKTVTITSNNGADDDNVFGGATGTLWDDSALTPAILGTYQANITETPLSPEEALAAFAGLNPNGVWTLSVEDTATADTGTLKGWSLAVQSTNGCASAAPAPPTTTPTPPRQQLGPPTKLKPRSLGLGLSKRDRKAPFKVTASGRLRFPAGVNTCTGRVKVVAKAGRKTVATKTVRLKRTRGACTYRAVFTFKKLPRSLPASGKLKVSARFLGNASLRARASAAASVRLG